MAGFPSRLWSVPVQPQACWESCLLSPGISFLLVNLNTVLMQQLPDFQAQPEPIPPAVYSAEPLDHLMTPQTHLPRAELLVLPSLLLPQPPPSWLMSAPSFQRLRPKTSFFSPKTLSMYKYHLLCLQSNLTSSLSVHLHGPTLVQRSSPTWTMAVVSPLGSLLPPLPLTICFLPQGSKLKYMSVMLQERGWSTKDHISHHPFI